MSLCPSCGREVASTITCPHCGANLKRRLTISLFGVLAIVLAIGGLTLLYAVSIDTVIPAVRIGQIQAAMNYAYVRVEGDVDRQPTFNPDSDSLTFWIDDGTGRMRVSAFRSEARALIDAGRVPSLGDHVAVEGALRVRDEVPSLSIHSIDSLSVNRITDRAVARDLGSITVANASQPVVVRGQVRAVRDPFGSLRLITIRDPSGAIDITIGADIEAFGRPAPEVEVGDAIQVTGLVTLYEDTPQITLTRGDQLSVLADPIVIANVIPIQKLGDDDIGQWVRVQGSVAHVAPFSSGVKFTLSDPQGQSVTLLLWQDVFEALPDRDDWQIGAEVIAQGAVNSFRGELEIVPEIGLDVAILTRAVASAATAEPIDSTLKLAPIGSLTPADVGRTVFVSGTVESVDRFSTGVRFRVKDDSGSILLVVFDDVLDQVEDSDRLQEGAGVSALGRVSEFNGALEIIPPNGASVRVIPEVTVASRPTPTPELRRVTPTPTLPNSALPTPESATPTPTPTSASRAEITIASIRREMIGQSVTIRGQVIGTSSFSAGFRFTVNDGSGSIDLILFDGNYRELSNPAGLNLGARVKATAIVAEFNGELQLQPASGVDVIVEQPGSTSIITTRAINTLSSADIGTLVTVVGDVLRVEGFSAGVSVFVHDGTGEIRVVIFTNVLNFVPNAPSLQAGARARVVGRIDEFSGALELVPALGYDVTVNP